MLPKKDITLQFSYKRNCPLYNRFMGYRVLKFEPAIKNKTPKEHILWIGQMEDMDANHKRDLKILKKFAAMTIVLLYINGKRSLMHTITKLSKIMIMIL